MVKDGVLDTCPTKTIGEMVSSELIMNSPSWESFEADDGMTYVNLEGKVLVIDDVITAGTAIREVVEIIRNTNALISGVAVALDRQERGLSDLSAIQEIEDMLSISVISIISLEDIISYLESSEDKGLKRSLEGVKTYRYLYGT